MTSPKLSKKVKVPLPKVKLLKTEKHFSVGQLGIFIVVFAAIGGYLLYRSFAASPVVASVEAESMSLPTGASVISDSLASGGKAMMLSQNGSSSISVSLPSQATSLSIAARGGQCSGSPAMTVSLDGNVMLTNTSVAATTWTAYSANTNLTAAAHTLNITGSNLGAVYNGNSGKTKCSRVLYLDVTTFYGPALVSPTVTLTASPATVTSGQTSTLSWSSTNATACSASGAWSGSQPTSGSTSTAALSQTSTYSLTCTGSGGSATASATVTVTANTSSSYPASFFTGPAGTNNLLPPNGGYPSKGVWLGEESGNGLTQVTSREQYFGRKFNIASYYSQNRCDDYPTITADNVSHGYIPLINWFPSPANADQIISGAADTCIKSFASSVASGSSKVFVRPYWEFNGGWYPFSNNSNGTRATADQEKQMWQHTVDVIRTTAAAPKISFVWCPDEGYYNNHDAWNNPTPYPGDNYVDWVCSDQYNHNGAGGAWCGALWGPVWCDFPKVFTHGYFAPTYTPIGVEASFRGQKPFMIGETGSVEDPNTVGRKGQWMGQMESYIKSYMPGLYALNYFDVNYTDGAWNLDSSTSSMDGFKTLANDPYFKIPNQ